MSLYWHSHSTLPTSCSVQREGPSLERLSRPVSGAKVYLSCCTQMEQIAGVAAPHGGMPHVWCNGCGVDAQCEEAPAHPTSEEEGGMPEVCIAVPETR